MIAAPLIIGTAGGNYWVRVLDFAMLYVMLALGLNVVVGFAGLLDLGYIAFYAVGRLHCGAAVLAAPDRTSSNGSRISRPNGLHVPFLIIVPCAAWRVAALFGVLLGRADAACLRGDYLAIVTLGFGEIVRIFLNNLDRPVNITNGPKGITAIDPVHWATSDLVADRTRSSGFKFSSVYMYYYLFVLWRAARDLGLYALAALAYRPRTGPRSAKTKSPPRRWASTRAT